MDKFITYLKEHVIPFFQYTVWYFLLPLTTYVAVMDIMVLAEAFTGMLAKKKDAKIKEDYSGLHTAMVVTVLTLAIIIVHFLEAILFPEKHGEETYPMSKALSGYLMWVYGKLFSRNIKVLTGVDLFGALNDAFKKLKK